MANSQQEIGESLANQFVPPVDRGQAWREVRGLGDTQKVTRAIGLSGWAAIEDRSAKPVVEGELRGDVTGRGRSAA
jgi:hypothetical protein